MLEQYGATKPAEFFAVATECFHGKPARLRKKHTELYEKLRECYRQVPERAFSGEGEPSSARTV